MSTTQPTAKTEEQLQKEDEILANQILALLKDRIFTLYYRSRYRPTDAIIYAENIQIAKQKAWDYCQRFKLRFISVRPFFMDLEATPEENEVHS